MKSRKRYIIGFAVFLAVFGILVLGFLKVGYFNPNRHQSDIIRWVEARYEVKLKIGLIFPIIYPGLGVEIDDVEIDLPDPARSRPELFKTRNLKAVLDLKELAKRRLKMRDLILIEPEIYYEWGPAEKARLRNIQKSKNGEQKLSQAKAERGLRGRLSSRVQAWLQLQFNPEELLNTNRILVSGGRLTVADFRDRPSRIPDIEFAKLDITMTPGQEKNSFNFTAQAPFPYSEKGLPGLKLQGKGKVYFWLKPFAARVISESGSWGTYPIKQWFCELVRSGDRIVYRGYVESTMDLERLNLLMSWPPLKKYDRLRPFQLEGQADYRVRFKSGKTFWERFYIERLKVDNLAAVLFNPGPDSPLKEPVMFKKARLFARDIVPGQPVPVELEMPFPYQEPIRKLTPFPFEAQGMLTFDEKFKKSSFLADKAGFGDNVFNKLTLAIDRSAKPVRFQGSVNLRMNDLSQFKQVLLWRVIKTSRNINYMNFSGKGRLMLDFRYPEIDAEGTKKLWYQGTARLWNTYFDPGAAIAPIDQFNGEIAVSSSKISTPVYWFHISNMPVQSDLAFTITAQQNPRFEFHTTANELDLAQLFIKRLKPPDPSILPGSTLPPMRTIYVGDFNGQRARYRKIVCEEVKTRWKFKDRVLGFYNLTLNYHQGWFQDAGSWVDFRRANRIEFHVSGHFENFQLRRMMDELFGYDFFVDGRVTGQGHLTAAYVDGKLDYSSLNGYFKVQVTNGSLLGYNLGIRILQFLGFKLDEKKFGLDFEKGKAEVVIKNGVVYFDDLSIKSWNLEAHCAGKVDLVKQKMRIWVAVYPLEVLSTVTKPIPLIGALINQTQEALFGSYAKAEGPWSDIKISAYLPLTEKVATAPKSPEFQARPWP